MKKLLFPALAAAVALSACAPKSHDSHPDQVKAQVEQTKTDVKNEVKSEAKKVEAQAPAPAPAPAAKTEVPAEVKPKVEVKTEPKADVSTKSEDSTKSQAVTKTEAPAVRADGKPEIFGKDFTCTSEFPARFAPFQSAFADAAKATDEALVAMQPVVDRLDDSSRYHVKVKDSYEELTKAYKAMLKEFGMTFGCFYMLPKGAKVNITSDTFKAEYEQLRARVGKLIGTQHLGPEVTDI